MRITGSAAGSAEQHNRPKQDNSQWKRLMDGSSGDARAKAACGGFPIGPIGPIGPRGNQSRAAFNESPANSFDGVQRHRIAILDENAIAGHDRIGVSAAISDLVFHNVLELLVAGLED